MDKFRIHFKCNKEPQPHSGLEGFNTDSLYTGRSFNGFYEVSPKWGNGKQTRLLKQAEFEQYFEVVQTVQRLNHA